MGNVDQRAQIPLRADTERSDIISQWNCDDSQFAYNHHSIPDDAIVRLGATLTGVFSQNNMDNLNVLETHAGNLVVSRRLVNMLCGSSQTQILSWVATDAVNFNVELTKTETRYSFVHMNSVDAVAKFGGADILCMICPPPTSLMNAEDGAYGDYYACCDFIEKSIDCTQPKYIIFVGELGEADGSRGMYRYLHENPHLENVSTRAICELRGPLGDFTRALYVFRIKK